MSEIQYSIRVSRFRYVVGHAVAYVCSHFLNQDQADALVSVLAKWAVRSTKVVICHE